MEKKYRKEPVEIPPEIAETAAGGKVPETDVTEQYPQMEEMNGTEAAGEMPQIGPMYPIPQVPAQPTEPAQQMGQMPCMQPIPQMVPVVCCPFLLQMHCPMMPMDYSSMSHPTYQTAPQAMPQTMQAVPQPATPAQYAPGPAEVHIIHKHSGSPCGYGSDMYDQNYNSSMYNPSMYIR